MQQSGANAADEDAPVDPQSQNRKRVRPPGSVAKATIAERGSMRYTFHGGGPCDGALNGAASQPPGMQADRGRGCRGGVSFGKCAGMEAARHNGEPIHRTIVRQLRSASINGATTERGVWGFHGDHAPHGDRFLPAGRNATQPKLILVLGRVAPWCPGRWPA